MSRFTPQESLPSVMQGEWIDQVNGGHLVVDGPEVRFQSAPIRHDWFELDTIDGSLCVNFGVDDPGREDGFVRENLTNLVITEDGQFHGYNTKFGCTFEKVDTAQ